MFLTSYGGCRARLAEVGEQGADRVPPRSPTLRVRLGSKTGTVTVTQWLSTDGPYSVCLWISSHTIATAIRPSSSSRPSGSISASL